MRVFTNIDELNQAVGTELGVSEWKLIDQARVDQFAEATDDFQWIHVDADRAKDGPYGTTIAHGYLSLSLLPGLAAQIYRAEGFRMTMNYGLNKVRFPSVVPVGSRVRSSVLLKEVTDTPKGIQLLLEHTLHVESETKPAVIAEQIRLLVV